MQMCTIMYANVELNKPVLHLHHVPEGKTAQVCKQKPQGNVPVCAFTSTMKNLIVQHNLAFPWRNNHLAVFPSVRIAAVNFPRHFPTSLSKTHTARRISTFLCGKLMKQRDPAQIRPFTHKPVEGEGKYHVLHI